MGFLANPTARFTQHADSINGTSSGPGSAAAPWQTIDQAKNAVPSTCTAVGGATGVISLAGTQGSPQTYVSTAGITVSGKLTVKAENVNGAVIAGADTGAGSKVITVTTGGDLTTDGVIVDPSLNSAGAAENGILLPTTATAVTLTCNATKFQNFTDSGIAGMSTVRVNLTVDSNCVMVSASSASKRGIYLASHAAGSVTIGSPSITLTNQNLGSVGGGIVLIATGGQTPTVSIGSPTISVALDPTLTGSAMHNGIRVLDYANGTMASPTVQVTGAPGSRIGACVMIDKINNDISGWTIGAPVLYNATNGGYCFRGGIENSGVPLVGSNWTIGALQGSGSPSATAGGLHGVLIGCLGYVTVTAPVLTDTGLGFVDKGSDHTVLQGAFRIEGFSGSGIRAKGCTNSHYTGGAVRQTSAYTGTGAVLINAQYDDVTGALTTGLAYDHITWTNDGAANSIFASKTASDTATPANNVYNQTNGGTLASSPWQWGSANYPNLSAWQAGVEPTATGNAP